MGLSYSGGRQGEKRTILDAAPAHVRYRETVVTRQLMPKADGEGSRPATASCRYAPLQCSRFRLIKQCFHLLALYRRELLKEVVDRPASLKMIKQRFGRHSRSGEHRRAAEDLRIARYDFAHAPYCSDVSKVKLQQLLTRRLRLREPSFKLEKIGSKLAGSVISETFKGKSARQRVRMIWDALDAELGPEAVHEVGTLLTYTPEEWNIDLAAEV